MTQGHALLPRVWLRRGLLAWLLWPVSLVMRLLVALRITPVEMEGTPAA